MAEQPRRTSVSKEGTRSGSSRSAGAAPFRLTGRQTAVWYSAAAVSYIGLGVFEKWVLTWALGLFYFVAVVVIGPALWHRLVR